MISKLETIIPDTIESLKQENERLKVQLVFMAEERDKFKGICMTDPKTGLYNSRGVEWHFPRFIAHVGRENQTRYVGIVVIVIDVNNLKPMNDNYGHGVGDNAIRAIASALHRSTRKDEIAARLGGDEFLVIIEDESSKLDIDALPHSNSDIEKVLIARILESMRESEDQSSLPKISISFGASCCSVDSYGDETKNLLESSIKIADERMYTAKKFCKNRDFLNEASVLCGSDGEITLFYPSGKTQTFCLE